MSLPTFLDINKNLDRQHEDIPLVLRCAFNSRNIRLSSVERMQVTLFAQELDRKYRRELLEDHASNSNYKEVMVAAYPKSYQDDVDTLNTILDSLCSQMASDGKENQHKNQFAHTAQGFVSSLDNSREVYQRIFKDHTQREIIVVATMVNGGLSKMNHAEPLMEREIRARLMQLAFSEIDEEGLFLYPISWLIKATELQM